MIFQLEATRKELLTVIEAIPETFINVKESEKKWSIGQVLDHLHKTEVNITKVIKHMSTLPEQQDSLPTKPLVLTLDRTRKVKVSDSLAPALAELDKQELLDALAQSRAELINVIEAIPQTVDFTKIGYKHPVFGELSLMQWIEFIGYHEKRHLAQIEEVNAILINESV
ncbi:DinB family protein [Metabacillus malikii]|uniref:Damage-inducible protein DinB n=1 Tax=Metabacillus malikii TaxID=1504265 RepID=A0ABT9ZIK6_9BACI|nr:DinB family protein [Metabacillus malikii]MDQ0232105.1 putative damage-inducible protein DinB [Metabacillus malikii]